MGQLIDFISGGNHMWHGAIPIFVISPNSRAREEKGFGKAVMEMAPNRIRPDPIDCTRKYFTAASVSWFIFDRVSRGIKDRRFTSRPTQTISQLFADRARKVPRSSVRENIAR